MKTFEMPTMEGEIQTEEPVTSPKTNNPSKNKPRIKFNFLALKEKIINIIKSTKLKTVFILFFVFILVSVGLIVISSKKGSVSDTPPGIVITTPQPQQTIKNPQTKEIEDKLDIYDNKVDALGNNLNSFGPPQIDLNVNF